MSKIDELMEAAARARDRAYAPYSRFRVGAAARGASGAIHVGCNVENASYPLGLCAEAAAIAAMVAAGERRISDIAVVGEGDDEVAPCGACRQRILEFAGADARVILGARSAPSVYRIDALLPHAFRLSTPTASSSEPRR